ncbi:SHOCT domain-containing protein [Sphingomonas zeae]|jgi:hypothetical protein
MRCSGCGKGIPFGGQVCLYCHREKSSDQAITVFGTIGVLFGGFIGNLVGGFGGMLVGAFGLGFIALVFISVTGSKKGHSAKRPPRIQLEPTPKAKSESSNPDAAIRLAKLKQLMGDGLITDEEYQRQRSKIVDSL